MRAVAAVPLTGKFHPPRVGITGHALLYTYAAMPVMRSPITSL
jgi:hypothetical protein